MGDSRVWLRRALLLTGVVCLGWFGLVILAAEIFQREQATAFERLRATQQIPPPPSPVTSGAFDADTNLIGMLDIPRLSLSTPVVKGDDTATLQLAVGHLPDTPKPWETGNSAIAGHRDGLFRPLKNIRIGDEVVVRTARGDLRYRVSDTRIVRPDDLSVLRRTDAPMLTLITCYPFHYVGSAPKRFIVRAERIRDRATRVERSVRGDVHLTAPPVQTQTVRKATAKKVAVGKRKPRKVVAARAIAARADTSAEPRVKDGKARRFFRKIGSFFKESKSSPPPGRAAPSR